MKISISMGAAALVALLGAGAGASPGMADKEKTAPAGAKTLMATDKATIQKLHDANQMQVQMGKLAQEKGTSKALRELGRRLIADHTTADRALENYLRRHGADFKALATTTSTGVDHDVLATKSGADFERAFCLQLVSDHQKAIELLESARIGTSDDTLRALYDGLLPTLREHKKTAQDILTAGAKA